MTKSKMLVALGAGLLLAAGAAQAEPKACEANYKQEGGFLTGRRFSTWGDVSGTSVAAVYKKLYTEAVKTGFRIASADKEMGLISAEQLTSNGKGQIAIPWNFAIEQVKTGTRVTVSKTTPPGYATGEDAERRMLCSVIDSAK